ncbi:MAG TPA: hypothetical protein PLF40_15765, partial [Kofleriaceae bacterium]|nr:hypothetical protein [Kofleriaceae bacterium]
MGQKIITKTDRQMEDRMHAVSDDPIRADVLAKARTFKRSWLELAECLSQCQAKQWWRDWGYDDFDSYCKKELHLRTNTVAKLLGSYRFLETAAPRVIDRAREQEGPIPSMAAVNFVAKATERGAADEETIATMHRVAFEEGVEAPLLSKRFKEAAFPINERERAESQRSMIAQTARKLAALVAEDGAPV